MKELSVGKVFKNYKELCKYLDEPLKTGNAKIAQMKGWERYFKLQKDGHKMIVEEVYEVTQDLAEDKRCKTINPMIRYLRLMSANITKDYHSFTDWICEILWLLNKNVCDISFQSGEEIEEFCSVNEIINSRVLRDYPSKVRIEMKNQLLAALKYMAKYGVVDYRQGYRFLYDMGDKKKGFVATDKLNEIIKKHETIICNEMNEEYKISDKMKGRQLLFVIQKRKCRRDEFVKRKLEMLMKDSDALKILDEELFNRFGNSRYCPIDEKHPLVGYYDVLQVTRIDGIPGEAVDPDEVRKIGLEICNAVKTKVRKQMTEIKILNKYGSWKQYWPYKNIESQISMDRVDKLLYGYIDENSDGLFADSVPVGNRMPLEEYDKFTARNQAVKQSEEERPFTEDTREISLWKNSESISAQVYLPENGELERFTPQNLRNERVRIKWGPSIKLIELEDDDSMLENKPPKNSALEIFRQLQDKYAPQKQLNTENLCDEDEKLPWEREDYNKPWWKRSQEEIKADIGNDPASYYDELRGFVNNIRVG